MTRSKITKEQRTRAALITSIDKLVDAAEVAALSGEECPSVKCEEKRGEALNEAMHVVERAIAAYAREVRKSATRAC